ncbi:MAG: diacylglycerol kinase [Bdellovibrionales bacterium]
MKNKPFRKRLRFALHGIEIALKRESSFRFQCLIAVLVLSIVAILGASPMWWGLLIITIGSVLSTEMINTALEYLIDRLHPELHPEIKRAKDCAAGAVLLSSVVSIGVFVAFLLDWTKHRS